MSTCTICHRRITRNRIANKRNVCAECLMNIKTCNYKIFVADNDNTDQSTSVNSDEISNSSTNDDSLIIIDNSGKDINIKEDFEININIKDNPTIDNDMPVNFILDNKDLLTTFIKDTLSSTVNKLYDTIEFLKHELEEKNMLVRKLLQKHANESSVVDVHVLEKSENLYCDVETRSSITGQYNSTQQNNLEDRILVNYSYNSSSIITNEDSNGLLSDDSLFNDSVNLNKTINVMNSTTRAYESIEDQLKLYRLNNHNKYTSDKLLYKCDDINTYKINDNKESFNNFYANVLEITNTEINKDNGVIHNNKTYREKHMWPENTVLVTGDSMLNGLTESRLNKKFKVKMRAFPGANVEDMYDYISPLLRKNPTYIILHIGSNDCPNKSSDVILDDMLELKQHIETILPATKVYLSCPILRFDNAKTGFNQYQLGSKVRLLDDVILNDNIDSSCLGRAGLHLNRKGSGRLAINFLSLIKRL